MDEAHRRLPVTASAFSTVVDHLVDTLVGLDVEPDAIAALIDAVRSLQPQIVSKRGGSGQDD